MTAVLPGEPRIEMPALPELTVGRVRHYRSHLTLCAWCERPITNHILPSSDGYRWITAGDCVNPVPEACD